MKALITFTEKSGPSQIRERTLFGDVIIEYRKLINESGDPIQNIIFNMTGTEILLYTISGDAKLYSDDGTTYSIAKTGTTYQMNTKVFQTDSELFKELVSIMKPKPLE